MSLIRSAKRALRFLLINRRARREWLRPGKADVAILYAPNVQYLLPLCEGHTHHVVPADGEVLYVYPGILAASFWHACKAGDPTIGYLSAVLDQIRPRIVISFIDNSDILHDLSRYYRATRFLVIQNAARYDVLHLPDEVSRRINIPEFACFGHYEIDLYSRKGATVGQFFPIGSLRDSYYRAQRDSTHAGIDYDICVVGEPSLGWDALEGAGFEDAIGVIATYAVRFARQQGKRLCIAGKRDLGSPARDAEVAWYRKYIGDEAEVMPRQREDYSTYRLIDCSAVSVSFISTALQEGMARGNRVLFCNYTGQERWNFPVSGIWLLTELGYEAFEARMMQLLDMTDREFSDVAQVAAQYTTSHNENCPAHQFLRTRISQAVAGDSGSAHG